MTMGNDMQPGRRNGEPFHGLPAGRFRVHETGIGQFDEKPRIELLDLRVPSFMIDQIMNRPRNSGPAFP